MGASVVALEKGRAGAGRKGQGEGGRGAGRQGWREADALRG